jgi:DNA processing protein
MSIRYWLALQRAPGVGLIKALALSEKTKNLAAIFSLSRQDLVNLGVPESALACLLNPNWDEVEADLRWAEEVGCAIITWQDESYPVLLRQISVPPAVLYVQGDSSLLNCPQLAMVGSRNPTSSGVATAQQFAKYLAEAGLVITSGLALGIDGASHRGALAAKGKTIAVLGSGLSTIYPPGHQRLSEEIVSQGGLLVSEFALNTRVRPEHFPRRNRIISGMSMGVLVVEAALKSGSLITARLAMEQGREVFAIPGSIHNPLARGCHALLKQGAKLVETAQDIAEELGALYGAATELVTSKEQVAVDLDQEYQTLLNCIDYQPTPVDLMVARSGWSSKVISSMLLILELQGMVESMPGGYVRR